MAKARKPISRYRLGSQRPRGARYSKLSQLETLLRRPEGATIGQHSRTLDWQAHSTRRAMSGV